MQRYTNLVQDNAGNALGGVTVAVYATGTSNLATLYNSNGSGAKSNPFTNDSDGTFEFYATTGRYDIVYTKTGYTFTAANYTDIKLYDQADSGIAYTAPALASPTFSGTYTLSGTATVTGGLVTATGSVSARSLAARYAEVINVKDYGAIGDGVTNDYAAIVAAYAAVPATGAVVYWPSGTYLIGGVSAVSFAVPSYTQTVFAGGVVIDITTWPNSINGASFQPVFAPTGTEGTEYALASNATIHTKTVTLSVGNLAASGIAADDWIRVASNEQYDPLRTASEIGELVQVKSVDPATGIITLWTWLHDDYATADTAVVSKITMVRNVSFTGPMLMRGGNDPTSTEVAFKFWRCENPVVEGLSFENISDRALWFIDCVRPVGNMLFFNNFHNDSSAYGIAVDNASCDGRFTNFFGNKIRHLFTTTNTSSSKGVTRRISVDGFCAVNEEKDYGAPNIAGNSIDTHSCAEDIEILNGTIFSRSGTAINLECSSGTVRNVSIYGGDESTSTPMIALRQETARSGSWVFDNLKFHGCAGHGIVVNSGVSATVSEYTAISISNVIAEQVAGHAIRVGSLASARIPNVQISNVTIRDNASTLASVWLYKCDKFLVNNIIINGPTQVSTHHVRLTECKDGIVHGVVAEAATNATGSIVYVDADSAGGCDHILIDSIHVKAGTYTSLRGILVETDATNITIGPQCDLVAATTPVSIAAGAQATTRATIHPSVSADVGDAAKTLDVWVDETTQVWNTAIAADRAVTLSTTNAYDGAKFRVVRTAAATGAFNLNVGTGPLKALAVGTWCDVEYTGSAWMLTAYGAL